jgi:phosphoserine aminotransferase
MMRKRNFSAGPAALPLPVLEKLQNEVVDYRGIGMSMLEISHRSGEYETVHNRAIELIRKQLGVPSNYHVLFLGGGATLQFAMVPLNFLASGSCDFTLTGAWANKAYRDAKKIGKTEVVFDGTDKKYTTLPDALRVNSGASYLHLTSNETIGGLQWQSFPETGDVPIVADMSSDILSRRIPVERFGLIYAGAQKNLGPAGATVVIVREDMIERCPASLPAYLSYKTHSESNSLYNTPPVFGIYVIKLVLEWIEEQGGLAKIEDINAKKARFLYAAVDESDGFYNCPVDPRYRSKMNVVFTLRSEDLQKVFLSGATENGMVGLKGHRSVGGCRASIYNATSYESVSALVDFMKDFARRYG